MSKIDYKHYHVFGQKKELKFPQILKDIICASCLHSLIDAIEITFQNQKMDFQHIQGKIYFDDLIFFWNYSRELETLVHWIKYQRGKRLGRKLGQLIGGVLSNKKIQQKDAVIIPVPLHPLRFWKRGYNQSELLAQGISETCGLPVLKNILRRNRHTKSQSKLSAEQRQNNVKDAFQGRLQNHFQNKIIYLVDDVATTGATINNCARILKSSGAQKVICIVLARPILSAI